MEKKIKVLEKGIIEGLPQIPYVIDQVGEAINWVKEVNGEAKALKILQSTYEVVQYATKISDPNFYKTRLVLASLLTNIPNVFESDRFSRFDGPSKTTENAIKSLRVPEELVKERGCFNAIIMHVSTLATQDEELLNVFLIHALTDLREVISGMKEAGEKSPITPQDYITVLGYALVLANISLSNFSLLNTTQDVINEIRILLNNDVIY